MPVRIESMLARVCQLAVTVALLVGTGRPVHGAPRDTILGRWGGESICVKAPWNSACNDEQIVYQFEPSPTRKGGVIQHAFKLIGGVPQLMGDLEFRFDSAGKEWVGDFANSRTRVRWFYKVSGENLTGRVVVLNSGKVGRRVRAHRVVDRK